METSRAATAEPVSQEDWEDPEIQRVGTEPARASFFSFQERDRAMRNDPGECDWIIPLGGTWSFQWSPDPWSRPIDFYRRDFDTSQWALLEVPSNWQLHGHGDTTSGIYQLPLEESGRILSAHISSTGILVRSPDVSSL